MARTFRKCDNDTVPGPACKSKQNTPQKPSYLYVFLFSFFLSYSSWYSQVVSHPSTNQDCLCLASKIRVYLFSTGNWRMYPIRQSTKNYKVCHNLYLSHLTLLNTVLDFLIPFQWSWSNHTQKLKTCLYHISQNNKEWSEFPWIRMTGLSVRKQWLSSCFRKRHLSFRIHS